MDDFQEFCAKWAEENGVSAEEITEEGLAWLQDCFDSFDEAPENGDGFMDFTELE